MTGWRKSSASGADQCCVWVEITPDAVLVREDNIGSETLEFTHDEWRAFVAGVLAGEFDLEAQPAQPAEPAIRKTATYVRDLEGFAGTAKLYRVEPPATWGTWGNPDENSTDYLVVSAAVVQLTGPETYIFPGNESGEIASWGELDGSYRGALDHEQALRNAGYEVQP